MFMFAPMSYTQCPDVVQLSPSLLLSCTITVPARPRCGPPRSARGAPTPQLDLASTRGNAWNPLRSAPRVGPIRQPLKGPQPCRAVALRAPLPTPNPKPHDPRVSPILCRSIPDSPWPPRPGQGAPAPPPAVRPSARWRSGPRCPPRRRIRRWGWRQRGRRRRGLTGSRGRTRTGACGERGRERRGGTWAAPQRAAEAQRRFTTSACKAHDPCWC